MKIDPRSLAGEVTFRAVRSGGSGGQHVNKVSTRVELMFDIPASRRFSENQKKILLEKLKTRISTGGVLRLTCDTERSQHANRIRVFERFILLLTKALTPARKRIATAPSSASKEKRIRLKKAQSEKKARRKWGEE